MGIGSGDRGQIMVRYQVVDLLLMAMGVTSVLPLPVGTGRPRPPHSKRVLILTMKLWKMKKSCDFDHEIMNLVEKTVGTPAILGRTLGDVSFHVAVKFHLAVNRSSS
jgi:hypothetical protein